MRVDLVSEAQYESLIDLLCELHAYYNEGALVSRDIVREHLLENLVAPGSPHRLVVASKDDGNVAGLVAIGLVYSLVEPAPDKRKHCQIKEVYVRSSERNQGVGEALMSWVAKYAWESGCRRMDWPVKASNTRGRAFYEGLGAELVTERLAYRISDANMKRLAGLRSE